MSDDDVDITKVLEGAVARGRSPLEYAALALTVSAALLLLAGVLYAFAVADARDVDGSERFRLLAQASSPFVAALVLAAIAILVVGRRHDEVPRQTGGVAVMTVAAAVALVALLLAVNGMVVDLTTAGVGGLFRVSNVIGRLATVVLAGLALWLTATAPKPVPLDPPKLGAER